jgi:[ribosomal protein S5]-alanine N-acetyltransferase
MTPQGIQSRRLVFVPITLELIRAELEQPSRLEELLRAHVPPSWPPGEYDRGAMEFFQARLETDAHRYHGWLSWYVITPARGKTPANLIAGAGYLGPPDDETVEIGYSVVPEARRFGYATEIVEALVRRAFETGVVRRVVAETMASNEGSRRVLERNGFAPTGAGRDVGSVRYERLR